MSPETLYLFLAFGGFAGLLISIGILIGGKGDYGIFGAIASCATMGIGVLIQWAIDYEYPEEDVDAD